MAADRRAVMSDSFAEEFSRSFFDAAQGDRKHWPYNWPAGLLFRRRAKRPYRAGTYNRPMRPTTEEYPRFANSSPLKLRHVASFGMPIEEFTSGLQAEVAIDADGFVYTGGRTSHDFKPDLVGNPFGTGPDFPHEGSTLVRSTMWRQVLRKPYSPLASFAASRFKKAVTFPVAIGGGATVACVSYLLSDDGKLWAAGHPHLAGTDEIDAFPPYADGSVPYFTPRASASYVTPSGQVLSQEGFVFADIAGNTFNGDISRSFGFYFLAVTTSGKLLIRCDQISSRLGGKWYEAAGFVDSVTVSSGGSGYPSNTSVVASAPDNPNGVRALMLPVVNNGVITEVRILEPGWGYTSPPTLTISPVQSPSPSASLQAHLFSGHWSKAFSFGDRAAALTNSGRLYVWGDKIPVNRSFAINLPDSCYSPRRFYNEYAGGYRDVAWTISLSFSPFVAVRNDGGVDWARVNPANGQLTLWNLQSYTPSEPITSCAARISDNRSVPHVCLLSESGVVSRYGEGFPIATLQTQARFSEIFSGMETVSANRVEQLDEYGNRNSSLAVINEGFG